MASIQAVRGMNDVLPTDTWLWQLVEQRLRETFSLYGYNEIRFPIVEKTELFARSIGQQTDIVSKEMYTFDDRNGDSLTLRPEGTAGCVRACINNGLLHNQQQRVWYNGPMFRHERPQKGRYRQFHQVGIEAYGWSDPNIDAEILLMSAAVWQALGIQPPMLQLNSLGTRDSRKKYICSLVEYLEKYKLDLDEDSQRRLETNPLRILDTKNQATQKILEGAPSVNQALDLESAQHFECVQQSLDDNNLDFIVNHRLVRGLDYYSQTVFEWVSDDLGTQATVCAGGRYDDLVQQLGGKPVPAIGFAIGLERLIEIIRQQSIEHEGYIDIYLILSGTAAPGVGLKLAQELRTNGFRSTMQIGALSVKNQMKKANKLNAKVVVIIGEQEIDDGTISVKPMIGGQPQQTVKRDQAIPTIKTMLELGI